MAWIKMTAWSRLWLVKELSTCPAFVIFCIFYHWLSLSSSNCSLFANSILCNYAEFYNRLTLTSLVVPNCRSIEKTALAFVRLHYGNSLLWFRAGENSTTKLLIFGPAWLCDEGNKDDSEAASPKLLYAGAIRLFLQGILRRILPVILFHVWGGWWVLLFRLQRMTESYSGCQRRNEKPELAAKSCFL